MKIKISNLGVVKEAEIDLKPLTVFIGENNTGKTWTAYTLLSIFSDYGYRKYLDAYLEKKTLHRYPPLDNAIKDLINNGASQVDFTKFIDEYAEVYINDLACLASSWMPSYMATEMVSFGDLKVEVQLSSIKSTLIEKVKRKFAIEGKIGFGSRSQEASLNFLKEEEREIGYFYTSSEGNVVNQLSTRVIQAFVTNFVLKTIHRSFYSEACPFPTERTTFITLPLSSEINENKNIDISGKIEEKYPNDNEITKFISRPIYYFVRAMKYACFEDIIQREENAKSSPEVRKYLDLAAFLENEVLQGSVCFKQKQSQKILSFNISEDEAIEIQMASSSVKELTPLVLYLRYLAQPYDLIVIDEPEMNLHPAAQVEMAEFLAMLVQADLNVLITTHSPYIVDHLANLMQAAKHEDKDSIKDKFYLERTDAFIPQEKVSVYLFEDGTAKNILNENGRIDWGTFSNVSEDLLTIADMIS